MQCHAMGILLKLCFSKSVDNKIISLFQPVVVSGAKTSDMDAFPVDAVKSFHEKPMPTHDKGASNKPKMPIQQPRK